MTYSHDRDFLDIICHVLLLLASVLGWLFPKLIVLIQSRERIAALLQWSKCIYNEARIKTLEQLAPGMGMSSIRRVYLFSTALRRIECTGEKTAEVDKSAPLSPSELTNQ